MSYATFEITDNGAMLPVTAVYMTEYERKQWEKQNEPIENIIRLPFTKKSTPKKFTTSHFTPGVYRWGSASLSDKAMKRFLDTKKSSRNNESIARKLKISVNTVQAYTCIARKNKLI